MARRASQFFRQVAWATTSTTGVNALSFGFVAHLVELRNDSTGTGAAGRVYYSLASTAASTSDAFLSTGETLPLSSIVTDGVALHTTSTAATARATAFGGVLGPAPG